MAKERFITLPICEYNFVDSLEQLLWNVAKWYIARLLQESYLIECKLVGIRKAAVQYIQVGRTGVNANLIRIKQ